MWEWGLAKEEWAGQTKAGVGVRGKTQVSGKELSGASLLEGPT